MKHSLSALGPTVTRMNASNPGSSQGLTMTPLRSMASATSRLGLDVSMNRKLACEAASRSP